MTRPCKYGHIVGRYKGGRGACKECSRLRCKAQREAPGHKEWLSAYHKAYAQDPVKRKADRERGIRWTRTARGQTTRRAAALRRSYGMTLDEYEVMIEKQNCQCAICGAYSWDLKGHLNVDHDHQTGKVRELLCGKCNAAVGLCNDDPNRLEKAAKYLRKHGKK